MPLLALGSSPRKQEILKVTQNNNNSEFQLEYIKRLIVDRHYGDASDLLKEYIKSTASKDDPYLQKLYNFNKILYEQTTVGVDK